MGYPWTITHYKIYFFSLVYHLCLLQVCFVFNLLFLKNSYKNILFKANIRYEKLASAYEGFEGYHAETCEQIRDAFQKALAQKNKPTIINIAINPSADRKAQVIFFKIIINT